MPRDFFSDRREQKKKKTDTKKKAREKEKPVGHRAKKIRREGEEEGEEEEYIPLDTCTHAFACPGEETGRGKSDLMTRNTKGFKKREKKKLRFSF